MHQSCIRTTNNMQKSGKAIVAGNSQKYINNYKQNLYCRLIKSDNGQPLPTKNMKLLETKDKLIKDAIYLCVFGR